MSGIIYLKKMSCVLISLWSKPKTLIARLENSCTLVFLSKIRWIRYFSVATALI